MGDTYTVERSVHVEAPAERVYDHVVDFHRWPLWSPWEDVDPGLQRTYSGPGSGVGATYAWEGNRKAGKGTMEIVEAQPSSLLRIDLTFEKGLARLRSVAEEHLSPRNQSPGDQPAG